MTYFEGERAAAFSRLSFSRICDAISFWSKIDFLIGFNAIFNPGLSFRGIGISQSVLYSSVVTIISSNAMNMIISGFFIYRGK